MKNIHLNSNRAFNSNQSINTQPKSIQRLSSIITCIKKQINSI